MDRFNLAIERARDDISALESAWRDAHDPAASAVTDKVPPARPSLMQVAAIYGVLGLGCIGLCLFVWLHSL